MKGLSICFISLATAGWLGLTGCTECPVEDIVPAEAQLVLLDIAAMDLGMPEVLTRATTDPVPLPEGATVRLAAYYLGLTNEGNQVADFSTAAPFAEATYVVGAGGSLSPCDVDAEGRQIPGNNNKGLFVRSGVYDMYAVSPARPLQDLEGGSKGLAALPHKEDIMTSYARSVTVTPKGGTVHLHPFIRKCALVVFHVAASPDFGTNMKTLKGTRLQLTGMSESGAVLKAGVNQSIAKTGGTAAAAGIIGFEAGEFEAVATDSDPKGLGLNKVTAEVLPKNGEPFEVAITVMRNGVSAELKALINQDITLDEGKRYVFTLLVDNDVSYLTLRILGWNVISFEGDIGGKDTKSGTSKSAPFDPDICEGFGTPIVVAKWSRTEWNRSDNIRK